MPRGKKQEKKLCTAHTFSIKPKEIHACYYQQSISIKFCRIGSNQGTSSAKTIGNCYEGPTFNKDQNFSTPCFVLASDKVIAYLSRLLTCRMRVRVSKKMKKKLYTTTSRNQKWYYNQ